MKNNKLSEPAELEEMDQEEEDIKTRIKERLDKLRSRKAYYYLLTNPSFALKSKKRDEAEVLGKLSQIEENLPIIKDLIRQLRKYIPHIWDQSSLLAVYLLVGKAFSNLETIIFLAKKGHNLEIIELARSAVEAIDLSFLFLQKGQEERLAKWYEGKFIHNEKSRKVFHKVINEFNKNANNSKTDLPVEDLKSKAYEIYSLYTHSTYRSLLDAIDVFNEDFDFDRIAGFHYTNLNIHVVEDVAYKILLELKNVFIMCQDQGNLQKVEDLLNSLGFAQATQEEIDEVLKNIKQNE